MPLFEFEQTGNQCVWGVWHLEETEEELAFSAWEQCPEELISQQKRLEWLAGRVLIKTLLEKIGLEYAGIMKDEFGKPFLKELPLHISLTHSYPYVAAQINQMHSVGIDLEQPKQKLLAIGPRVLSPTELTDAGNDVVKHCVYWCAKEALYKIFGKRGLHFADQLNVEPFALNNSGTLKGVITVNDQKQNVNLIYQLRLDFVLVLTKTASV